MMMWFALHVNLVMSHLACMMHAHVHGACDLYKTCPSKYSTGLVYKQADPNLVKITAEYFGVLNTQNAN